MWTGRTVYSEYLPTILCRYSPDILVALGSFEIIFFFQSVSCAWVVASIALCASVLLLCLKFYVSLLISILIKLIDD